MLSTLESELVSPASILERVPVRWRFHRQLNPVHQCHCTPTDRDAPLLVRRNNHEDISLL